MLGLLALATLPVEALQSPSLDTGHVIGADGVSLYYEKSGSGPEVLIVPGRLFLARDFAPLAKRHTLILYDMRNRGRSSPVEADSLLTLHKDVEDLEAVRRHFGVKRFTPVGYSYLGLMVVLYAMEHPDRVKRLVQMGPVPRDIEADYPERLVHRDSVAVPDSAATARLDSLRTTEWAARHPREFCQESRRVNAVRLVGNPANASRLMDPCDMPNEWPARLQRHFTAHFKSVGQIDVSKEAVARVKIPVLTIHGTWDRNAPYAGGREWALVLPNARLLTIERAAHQVPADAPEIVLPAIEAFVAGKWPEGVEQVTRLAR